MINFKAVLAGVVEQGRRAILQATRAKINPAGQNNPLKLSEVQPDKAICRPRPKSVFTNHNCGTEVQGSVSANSVALTSSGGGGIVNLLRPVTSRIVQGLVKRVSSPLWIEARRKSAKRLFGETAPYFALVGVTLVSGPERGLLTAQDEMEAICGDIREAISRAGWIHNPNFWKWHKSTVSEEENITNKGFSLSDFDIGTAISKGCNAVVYAARWKEETKEVAEDSNNETDSISEELIRNPPNLVESLENIFSKERFWPLDRLENNVETSLKEEELASEDEHNENVVYGAEQDCNEGSSEDHPSADSIYFEESSYADAKSPSFSHSLTSSSDELLQLSTCYSLNSLSGSDFPPSRSSLVSNLRPRNSISLSEDINILLSNGGFQTNRRDGARNRKKVKFKEEEGKESSGNLECEQEIGFKPNEEISKESSSSLETYPLAVKMMFNYEAESNAPAILTAMYKEMIPAKSIQLDDTSSLWKQRLLDSTVTLPPHTNIVDMPCVFVDRIPLLSDGLSLYPDALPRRLNPSGYGRNMSLFCVMKRYDCTLAQYLSQQTLNIRTSLLLLTQMLEAVHHINRYSVAHRDLKTDNFLICLNEGLESPHLVLSDFGCCLPVSNLSVSFTSYEADPRVGNAALMAPEIKDASPGMLTWLNYSKSDLWSVGTIAYEIFGLENPFTSHYTGNNVNNDNSREHFMLDSIGYKEHQLPRLPKTVPGEIRCLIHDLLKRNPKQRPSSVVAATICQLSLWGPRKWLNRHALAMPSHNEVMRWLLCLSTKVLCEAGSTQSSAQGSRNNDSHSGKRIEEKASGQLEYEIVSTLLKRVHYSDIIQAIKWIRAF